MIFSAPFIKANDALFERSAPAAALQSDVFLVSIEETAGTGDEIQIAIFFSPKEQEMGDIHFGEVVSAIAEIDEVVFTARQEDILRLIINMAEAFFGFVSKGVKVCQGASQL
jgi:hypothetical protein